MVDSSIRVVVSNKRNYVHKVLVNYLVKLAQENNVVRGTDRSDMAIAEYQTKQINPIRYKKVLMVLYVLFFGITDYTLSITLYFCSCYLSKQC